MPRKYPKREVTSDSPPANIDGCTLDVKGGTKAERDAAMDFAKRFAEGWLHRK